MAVMPSNTETNVSPVEFDRAQFEKYIVGNKVLSSPQDVALALSDRFDETGFSDATEVTVDFVNNVANLIYYGLPEGVVTAELVKAIDIRPFLNVSRSVAVEQDNSDAIAAVDKLIGIANAEVSFVETFISTTSSKPFQFGASGTTVGLGPIIPFREIKATTNTTDAGQVAATYQGAAGLMRPDITADQLRSAFIQSYSTDVMDVIQLEQSYTEQGMTIAPTSLQMNTISARGGQSSVGAKVRYSIPEAANYLLDQSHKPSSILQAQKNLAAAGYFDMSEMGYTPGDALDPETVKAWRAMLADSVKTGLPVDQLLRDKTFARSRNFDPGSRLAASRGFNEISQQLLGRNLSSTEIAGVLEYVKSIANTQGLQSNDIQTLQSGIDMNVAQEYIVSTTAGEQDQIGQQSQINEYRKVFGGS